MSHTNQKNREQAHLQAFKESLDYFPDGKILTTECPDFLVQNGSEIIGIELTELFHEPRSDGTILQARENYIFQILTESKRRYKEIDSIPVMVWVSFSIHAKLGKRKVKPLAQKLVQIVQNNIPKNDKNYITIHKSLENKSLPPEFGIVRICRFNELSETKWLPTGLGGTIPEIPPEYIRERIDSKNNKVEEYRANCNKIWLLIVVDGYLPSTWFDVTGNSLKLNYYSQFDKTFIFDFQNNKAVQLNIN